MWCCFGPKPKFYHLYDDADWSECTIENNYKAIPHSFSPEDLKKTIELSQIFLAKPQWKGFKPHEEAKLRKFLNELQENAKDRLYFVYYYRNIQDKDDIFKQMNRLSDVKEIISQVATTKKRLSEYAFERISLKTETKHFVTQIKNEKKSLKLLDEYFLKINDNINRKTNNIDKSTSESQEESTNSQEVNTESDSGDQDEISNSREESFEVDLSDLQDQKKLDNIKLHVKTKIQKQTQVHKKIYRWTEKLNKAKLHIDLIEKNIKILTKVHEILSKKLNTALHTDLDEDDADELSDFHTKGKTATLQEHAIEGERFDTYVALTKENA